MYSPAKRLGIGRHRLDSQTLILTRRARLNRAMYQIISEPLQLSTQPANIQPTHSLTTRQQFVTRVAEYSLTPSVQI